MKHGINCSIDFSKGGFELVGFDHDKEPTLFQISSVKAFCSKSMWSVIHGREQSCVFEWGSYSGTQQNWVQDFATVWSILYLPDFPHSSVCSEDDGSKEISGDLSAVD